MNTQRSASGDTCPYDLQRETKQGEKLANRVLQIVVQHKFKFLCMHGINDLKGIEGL